MEPNQQSAQGEAREQESLAPFQLDRLTIEEEVAFMNRGKGLQLLSVLALAGVLVAGGAMAMKSLDREQKLSQAGAAAMDLGREHLDAYLWNSPAFVDTPSSATMRWSEPWQDASEETLRMSSRRTRCGWYCRADNRLARSHAIWT